MTPRTIEIHDGDLSSVKSEGRQNLSFSMWPIDFVNNIAHLPNKLRDSILSPDTRWFHDVAVNVRKYTDTIKSHIHRYHRILRNFYNVQLRSLLFNSLCYFTDRFSKQMRPVVSFIDSMKYIRSYIFSCGRSHCGCWSYQQKGCNEKEFTVGISHADLGCANPDVVWWACKFEI